MTEEQPSTGNSSSRMSLKVQDKFLNKIVSEVDKALDQDATQVEERVYGEAELAILAAYLQSVVPQLLEVHPDRVHYSLQQEKTKTTLKAFAEEASTSSRSLVIAKYESVAAESQQQAQEPTEEEEQKTETTTEVSATTAEKSIELVFSSSVEYLGSSAMTIAFLKREGYRQLDLRPKEKPEKQSMDNFNPDNSMSTVADLMDMNGAPDLSQQLQVINMGYLGSDSNIFELAQNYVSFSFVPLFSDYRSHTNKGQVPSKDADESLGKVITSLNTLKVQLAQCQESSSIPEVKLEIEPEIKRRSAEKRAAGEVCKNTDFEDLLAGPGKQVFLDSLERYVQAWQGQIRKVAQLEHTITRGSSQGELKFWSEMENVLANVGTQLNSDEVNLTLGVLNMAKKPRLVMQFQTTCKTTLASKEKLAKSFNRVMRDFPLKLLQDSQDIPAVDLAVTEVFGALKSIKRVISNEYTIDRVIEFTKAVCRDFDTQVKKVINRQNAMRIRFDELGKLHQNVSHLKSRWKEVIKDATKGLAGQAAMITTQTTKLNEQLENLQENAVLERVDLIYAFRKEHHELHEVIQGSFTKDKAIKDSVLKEMHEAYEQFCNSADVLDVSPEGTEKFKQSRKDYEKSTSNIETQFAHLIKDKLSKASGAKAMFKVFSFYNKLLNRKKVRQAIQSYQADLLTQVMGDIRKLGERLQQEPKKEHRLSFTRSIPDTANRIIWLDQLKTRLKGYERQVRDVLGEEWERKQEAVDIKKECEMAERRLHRSQKYYVDTLTTTLAQLQVRNEKDKTIFRIEKRGSKNQLALNINEDLFFLHKEQLNLERIDLSEALGHGQKRLQIGYGSQSKINEVKFLYPVASSLKHSVRTFQVTLALVQDSTKSLLAKKMNDAMECFEKGLKLIWRNETTVKTFALKNLAYKVIDFEDAVTLVTQKSNEVDQLLEEIKVCEPIQEEFDSRLAKIQRIVEEFSFNDYSNLEAWVESLNKRIEDILVQRLGSHLESWINEFRHTPEELDYEPTLIKHDFALEFQIVNAQNIVLEPSLQEARASWYKQMHDQIEIICGRQRIESGSLTNAMGGRGNDEGLGPQEDKTYKNLLKKMGCDADGKPTGFTIKQCYQAIEDTFADAKEYSETWKSFQSLWDINLTEIYNNMLGDDISKWNQLLNEVRQGRKTIATNEDFKCFGRLRVCYGGVQAKVGGKYDQLHKEILNRFGETLGEKMVTFKSVLTNARKKLEVLDPQSTDVTAFVTEIQDMRIHKQKWEKEMGYCNSGQKLLTVQRYIPPSDWMGIGPLETAYSHFIQILDKRSRQFDEQKATLGGNIMREEGKINQDIAEIKTEWSSQRPDKAVRDPKLAGSQITTALDRLDQIGVRIENAKENLVRNSKAKELLLLGYSDPKQLDGEEEEYKDLREVWEAMKLIWAAVQKLNDTPFQVYQHRVVKECLEEKKEEMQKLPNRIRQWPVYEVYMGFLQDYKKVNDIMQDLHADSMKKRHWADLLGRLQMGIHQGNFHEMWLQHLWEANLLAKQVHINEVLTQARGEALIENFLYGSKETWKTRELEMARFKQKCKLIKGWEELRNGIDEHIANIASMKMSPYYKVFQEQIEPWDEKLQKMMLVFDTWQDLQTRYVYLEGIFFGSADIKTMLINEFNRFKDIDNKFNQLMKTVAQNPFVLAVLEIPQIEENLDKWVKHLNAIKKALGDYLEKQRQSFARFYFVGDDDLLEIIGNSKEIKSVQRHFPKMFAGITTVQSTEEGDKILGMISREGEKVNFSQSVNIIDEPAIYKWLTKVENIMQVSLATILDKALTQLIAIDRNEEPDQFNEWIVNYPAQMVGLAMSVDWSQRVEESLLRKQGATLPREEEKTQETLELLAERVLTDMTKEIRQKYEQLITECVHQRNVIREIAEKKCDSATSFTWLYYMRFYYESTKEKVVEKLGVKMANGQFFYGFEYLGVAEKLVQTPLTDRCYLTLTQAMHWRMGGSPFGPAGTGKTESVKALGATLGYFVLVFNCDETFDGNAMGRIFVGLCQVGAWGCFDEFNRLEERMLSAVSQQILTIQTGLREQAKRIQMMERDFALNPAMGIFITMNPDYAGRSNLPDNLKQLFRQMAMVKPDKNMIAQVMLFSQGFKTAERLSGKMVQLFDLCLNQLSSQSHYDFGLRALKSVLVTSGNLKRSEKKKVKDPAEIDANWEQNILLKSLCDTLVPKLIAEDIPLLQSLLSGVFPGADIIQLRDEALVTAIGQLCVKYNLRPATSFVEKVLQLNQIQTLCHGVMMVGPTGCGKTAAWRVLLDCLERIDGIKGVPYVIDPKAIHKDDLYGKLDATTAEWTDGVFTQVLRRVIDNAKGESSKRHWIIFDGDVDPEWAENLNSVLDDNKLLTLPSGERLMIPSNVRLMFEVETLKYATLATVSRCGMVWFSEDTVAPTMIFHHYLCRLEQDVYDALGEAASGGEDDEKDNTGFGGTTAETLAKRNIRKNCVDAIRSQFDGEACYMMRVLLLARKLPHIMDFTDIRVLEATFALLRKGIENILQYQDEHPDFPLEMGQMTAFMQKWLIFCTIWGVGGSMNLAVRTKFGNDLAEMTDVETPSLSAADLIDYDIRMEDQKWYLFKERVPDLDIEPRQVLDADFVITTTDTERHQQVLCSWLSEHRPFILCGPPGSGKTMTLMATLKMVQDMEMIFINFSSGTTPQLILKTFDHYCVEKKTRKGIVLQPHQAGKWLCVFCDEINLPQADPYNTQKVITFLRQMTEQGGFYRSSDKEWVHLERIQFVGACNPPQDAGRFPLTDRFLRHAPLVYVDFPGPASLTQIYGTFNKGMLKRVPQLRQYAEPLTKAMVEFYTESQQHFTVDMQAHYIYSPRELTRWKTALCEALTAVEEPEDLVRLYVHEGLRLFEDRLVYTEEKEWCNQAIDEVAMRCFPGINHEKALARPIYFTTYLTQHYQSVQHDELKQYIVQRLKDFYEEELNVRLVVFDSVLDHVLRIDRVLKQPLGHLLLIGCSGVGKTTLTRFVSWLNNLESYQIKAGRNYSVADFDEDLRTVMRKSGCRKEKICFIFDESNILSSAFLERMNALLAGGEVPGLFDGDDYTALINECKAAGMNKDGLDDNEAIYKAFTKNVQRYLHVVFTMNPANPDFSNRSASSPALFNRCVIDWFGDWTEDSMRQVAMDLTMYVDIPNNSFGRDMNMIEGMDEDSSQDPKIVALSNCLVDMHCTVRDLNERLMKAAKKFNYITPRDFIDLVKHFQNLHVQKKRELNELQDHLGAGLSKLASTESAVRELQITLKKFDQELEEKTRQKDARFTEVMKEESKVKELQTKAAQTKIQLDQKSVEIKERTEKVNADLGQAEPALVAAQASVSGLQDKDINELKSLRKPPAKVQFALEPVVALLLGSVTKPAWDQCFAQLKTSDFRQRIMSFDKNAISDKTKAFVMKTYIDDPNYDPDLFMRASKAVGPLTSWLVAIVKYADIFAKIAPMRAEVEDLEQQGYELEDAMAGLENEITQLKVRQKELTTEYEGLVTQSESLKKQKEEVGRKVTRSQNLYNNLSGERSRWQESSEGFKEQLANLVGDVLLSAGFLTYIGFFDHAYRTALRDQWQIIMDDISLRTSPGLSFVEYLSKPQARIKWQDEQLPNDELCIQNAIILDRFNRYPLIIDPSNQALPFLLKHYDSPKRKLQKTSFAEDAFLNHLINAIRFGLPLVVQDVEMIDPFLNSVLNKEVQKKGGRPLIRVGDKEVEYFDTFSMYMITRNQNAVFTPDLCSRVTFINFTVTQSSLMNQCLNIYLQHERPDIETKRKDLLKLQGEKQARLKELEDMLLTELSNSEDGNILENDKLIATLETLKKESAEIRAEMDQAEVTLQEIEEVLGVYKPLSQMSSRIFFTLQSLGEVHYLYQYSLQQYMDVLMGVLSQTEELQSLPKSQYDKRLEVMTKALFIKFNQSFSQGLLEAHQLMFAVRLAQIRIQDDAECNKVYDLFLNPRALPDPKQMSTGIMGGRLSRVQVAQLEELDESGEFDGLADHVQSEAAIWEEFMIAQSPEESVPEPWMQGQDSSISNKGARLLKQMTLIKVIRPDRFANSCGNFIKHVLGEESLNTAQADLGELVEGRCDPKSPLCLVSAPGFDASYRVEELAKKTGKKLKSCAIGSPEAFELATRMINEAGKSGTWVLLKNVHLAPAWLVELEKHVYKMQANASFRLFLTMENNPKVPSTLLRAALVLVFEPPAGIKAALSRSYKQSITPQSSDKPPIQRSRLHFIVAWFNAVVHERLRYTPIGWSKVYAFNEADQRCTQVCCDQWLDSMGAGRTNVDPDKIPWDALRTLIAQSVFGGKIDNEYDQKICQSLVDQFFCAESFNLDFELYQPPVGTDALTIPEGKNHKDFQDWIMSIQKTETPAWSGLPNNVEKIVRERNTKELLVCSKKIQGTGDDETLSLEKKSDKKEVGQAKWLVTLGETCNTLISLLPEDLTLMTRTEESIQNPLFRFLEREVTVAAGLLKTVRIDLIQLQEMCEGTRKSTNVLRLIAESIHAEIIPKKWNIYKVADITATAWINDFVKRVNQLVRLQKSEDFGKSGLWFGGLLFPEAYLTASRQFVAQKNNWSLEELDLKFELNLTPEQIQNNSQGFILTDMCMEGAEYDKEGDRIKLSERLSSPIPTVNFKWIHTSQKETEIPPGERIMIPVYLTKQRKFLLTSVSIPTHGVAQHVWYQRGAAVFAWDQ